MDEYLAYFRSERKSNFKSGQLEGHLLEIFS